MDIFVKIGITFNPEKLNAAFSRWKAVRVSGLYDEKFVKALTRRNKNSDFLFINYDCFCDDDYEIINQFIFHALKDKKNLCYAIKPNIYTAVALPALAYICDPDKLPDIIPGWKQLFHDMAPNLGIATKFKSLFKNSEANEPLTVLEIENTQNGKTNFKEVAGWVSSELHDQGRKSPLVEVFPASLSVYSSSWDSWTPNDVIKRRDVLDRFEQYYPNPRAIHVAILNKCNLQCVMCPYHSPIYKETHSTGYFDSYSFMSQEVHDRLIDYASRKKISLHYGQIEEPLMHKKFFDYIKQASDANVPHIHLTTNGTMLTAEKAQLLAESGIHSVMFSVDASEPETYKKIRGSDLHELEENIKRFIPLAKENNILIHMSFIRQEAGIDEQDEFIEKWLNNGVDKISLYALSEYDTQSGNARRSEQILEQGQRYACSSPWIQSVVLQDGTVSLCCRTMSTLGWRKVEDLGSLANESFDNIWAGQKYQKYRKDLFDDTIEKGSICDDCSIWSASTYAHSSFEEFSVTKNETVFALLKNSPKIDF